VKSNLDKKVFSSVEPSLLTTKSGELPL